MTSYSVITSIPHPRSSDNIADLKSIELGEIEVTEKQSLSSESSLIRPLSPIDWEAVGNTSRTDDKVSSIVTLYHSIEPYYIHIHVYTIMRACTTVTVYVYVRVLYTCT